jgi:two-component system, NtrC family, sensor histidine kinase HydH
MREAPTSELTGIRVLVASPDPVYARFLAERLAAEGIAVVGAKAPAPGEPFELDATAIDVVLVETHELDDTVWAAVETARERAPLIEIVAISSGPLVDSAVEALRNGVFAFLTYPVSDVQLLNEITRACARKRRGEERLRLTERRST